MSVELLSGTPAESEAPGAEINRHLGMQKKIAEKDTFLDNLRWCPGNWTPPFSKQWNLVLYLLVPRIYQTEASLFYRC
jgi:hypothetical protein